MVGTSDEVKDHELVVAWRELQFRRLVDDEQAARLATVGHVDAREFAELLAKGCSPDLAEKILV
jgi:hypothetical protein